MDTVFEHDYDFLDGIDKRWLHGSGTDEENNFQKQKHSTFKQNIILSFYITWPVQKLADLIYRRRLQLQEERRRDRSTEMITKKVRGLT